MRSATRTVPTDRAQARASLELVRGSIATAATLAHERTLPVADGLVDLVPSGSLQRGNILAVHGIGATSFALALAGEAVRDGAFLAVVAPPSFSLAACLDFDIPLRRVVQFVLNPLVERDLDAPQAVDQNKWAQAVAAVIEGFDVVVLADRHRVGASQARQLAARTRERGSLPVRVGGPSWPDAADLRFDVGDPDWSGLGEGHGYLQARKVQVQVAGRRYHGATRTHAIMLPAATGGAESVPLLGRQREQFSEIDRIRGDRETAKPTADRYAGADIDALLDVVDHHPGGTEAKASGDVQDVSGDGLDAIA